MARVQIVDENHAPINLAEVSAWDGEFQGLTPNQDYLLQIEEVAQEASKSKGTPQLVVKCTVLQGVETETHNGSKQTHWVPLTAKAAGRLKCFLDACLLVPDADGGFDDQDLVGRCFVAEAFDQEYKKTDPLLGEIVKTSTKFRKERPYTEGFGAAEGAAPTSAVLPTPPTPSTPPTPPAPAPTLPPAQPTAPPPQAQPPRLPPGPRVAGALPRPQRPIVPGARK
jgi:hypothetical protein